MHTQSEIFFERFCQATKIPFHRVPTESVTERRTPDYELRLGDLDVLAEVKQLDPNSDEKEARQRFERAGTTIEWQSELGARLRKKISEANSQLKSRVKPFQPAILVVYNNVDVLYGFTDPHNVMAAMYGQYEFVIGKSVNPTGRVVLLDRRLGGKRKLTHEHNTTLSALCVLFLGPAGSYLVVYHNDFAANPLNPVLLRHPQIYQYALGPKIEAQFPEWVRL